MGSKKLWINLPDWPPRELINDLKSRFPQFFTLKSIRNKSYNTIISNSIQMIGISTSIHFVHCDLWRLLALFEESPTLKFLAFNCIRTVDIGINSSLPFYLYSESIDQYKENIFDNRGVCMIAIDF